MNWTEGALQRHSRNAPRSLGKSKQKGSIARTRHQVTHASQIRPPPISFIESQSPTHRQSQGWRPASPRRGNWPNPDVPDHYTRTGQPLSSDKRRPLPDSRDRPCFTPPAARNPPSSRSSKRKLDEIASNQDNRPSDLEEKRRRLLRRGDWVGTSIQKPLLINFPARSSLSRREKWGFGNRTVSESVGNLWHQQFVQHQERLAGTSQRTRLQPQARSIRVKIGSQSVVSQITPLGRPRSRNIGLPSSNPLSSPRPLTQSMLHIEASPVTLHQPIPRRIAQIDCFKRSPSDVFVDDVGTLRCNTTGLYSEFLQSPRPPSGASDDSRGTIQQLNMQRTSPCYGPRFDYPPLSTSPQSEIQSLRFLARFAAPTTVRSPSMASRSPPTGGTLMQSPYFHSSIANGIQAERQASEMESDRIAYSPSEATDPCSVDSRVRADCYSGSSGAHAACNTSTQSQEIQQLSSGGADSVEISLQPTNTSLSAADHQIELRDKAEVEWLEFLELDSDHQSTHYKREAVCPAPTTEVDTASFEDGDSLINSSISSPRGHEIKTVATCGSTDSSSLEEDLLQTSQIHQLRLPRHGAAVVPRDALPGPKTSTPIYGRPYPSKNRIFSGDDVSESVAPRKYPDVLMVQDNMSILAQAPISEPPQEQRGRELQLAFTFAQPKPFVGRFAKTPVPERGPLLRLGDAPRRGRPKRKARDGRVSIRGIQNYYDDPIDE